MAGFELKSRSADWHCSPSTQDVDVARVCLPTTARELNDNEPGGTDPPLVVVETPQAMTPTFTVGAEVLATAL